MHEVDQDFDQILSKSKQLHALEGAEEPLVEEISDEQPLGDEDENLLKSL